MKKALSLILALILCLSLCACLNKQPSEVHTSSEDNIPSTETTVPQETALSHKDIMKEASAINLDVIGRAFDTNKVNAKDAYYNKYYTIVGTVRQLESDEVIILPITAVFGSKFSTVSQCHAKLSVDEIKKLSSNQVVKICGKLTDFDKGYNHYDLTLDEAFYVDNMIEVTAEISDVNNYFDGKKSIVLKETVQNGSSVGSIFYEITVAESGAENSEEAEFMGTMYYIGDIVNFSGVLKNNPNMGSNYYNVVTLDTINKNDI